ncbi:MAG: DNA helicase RecQ [Planctomycetes bacterium]|nr:DNA helicase RecQ [Planctomycetota bacterium]
MSGRQPFPHDDRLAAAATPLPAASLDPDEDLAQDETIPDVDGMSAVRSLDSLRAPVAGRVRDRMVPHDALRKYWGFDQFRPLQGEAAAAALAARDSLVVLPTGGGKSLCYQIPAVCGLGLTLVVSPLIALMDDQVAAAREAGLSAGALHGNITEQERRDIRGMLATGRLDLLYVSPERLCVGDLMTTMQGQLGLVAVDEAHCVSHWGHDFRPEYRQLAPILAQIPGIPRMALTATATPQVQDDICAQLALRDPARLVGHVDRANLVYRALPRMNGTKQVIEVVRRHEGEGGIVYAQTRKEVERLAYALQQNGIHAAGYHAGMEARERSRVQSDFVNERLTVVVATIAFGMGIDRSNVRFVIHANAPKSIEHYQQEAGRAGRDGDPAECVLLFSAGDLATHRALAMKDGALSPDRTRTLDRQLKEVGRFAVAPMCRHRLLTEHFGQVYEAAAAGCGACDVCLGESKELAPDEAMVTAQKIISTVWRTGGRYGSGHVVDVLLGRTTEKVERGGHAALAVFGLLKDAGEASLRAWIDQLLVQGLLMVTEDGDYPLVTLTAAGRALCKGEGEVRLGRTIPAAGRARKGSQRKAAVQDLDGKDGALFERLRRLRRLLAERRHVPPYVIFTDATLHLLASERPGSLSAMLEVKGVGERKLKLYGPAFLTVVAGGDPEAVVAS